MRLDNLYLVSNQICGYNLGYASIILGKKCISLAAT